MKTKVFKQVKKQIAVFASVCIVAGLALTYVACSADEMTAEQRQAEKQFETNLQAFDLKQQQLLDNLKGTRAGSGKLSMEEVQNVTLELAENMDAFMQENAEYLASFQQSNDLTEEELELMKLDPEEAYEYFKENSSEAFFNTYADLHEGKVVNMNNVKQELNPLEYVTLDNVNTYNMVANMVVGEPTDYSKDNSQNEKALEKALEKCEYRYMEDMKICGIAALSAGLLGLAGTPAFSALSAVGTYTVCAIQTKVNYNRCVEDAKERNPRR